MERHDEALHPYKLQSFTKSMQSLRHEFASVAYRPSQSFLQARSFIRHVRVDSEFLEMMVHEFLASMQSLRHAALRAGLLGIVLQFAGDELPPRESLQR
ncbi:MAG: hypothetical protein NVS3B20_18120 [Polyangiales bacterium]